MPVIRRYLGRHHRLMATGALTHIYPVAPLQNRQILSTFRRHRLGRNLRHFLDGATGYKNSHDKSKGYIKSLIHDRNASLRIAPASTTILAHCVLKLHSSISF